MLGFALICAGVFLLVRRRVLFNKANRDVGDNRETWYDIPNHIKMFVFGLGLIGFGCLSIYGAIVEWFRA